MSPESGALPAELFQALVEQSPDAMIYADRQGIVRVWNRAAEAIFGYTAAEALGASLDLIIPDRFRRAHWDGYRRALADGETRYAGRSLTTRAMPKDGGKLYVELSFAMVKDAGGSTLGVLATGRVGAAPAAVPKPASA